MSLNDRTALREKAYEVAPKLYNKNNWGIQCLQGAVLVELGHGTRCWGGLDQYLDAQESNTTSWAALKSSLWRFGSSPSTFPVVHKSVPSGGSLSRPQTIRCNLGGWSLKVFQSGFIYVVLIMFSWLWSLGSCLWVCASFTFERPRFLRLLRMIHHLKATPCWILSRPEGFELRTSYL